LNPPSLNPDQLEHLSSEVVRVRAKENASNEWLERTSDSVRPWMLQSANSTRMDRLNSDVTVFA